MLKEIEVNTLLASSAFIREPVDELCRKLKDNSNQKIILSGGRGTGKTVVLYQLVNQQLGSPSIYIYVHFDPAVLFDQPNELFNEQFIMHYYEVTMAKKLLNFIKKNYGLTYQKYSGLYDEIQRLSKQTSDYINHAMYGEMQLSYYLESTAYVRNIISSIKKDLKLDRLSLIIDRFDWTNGSSAFAQNILRQYFDLFEQVIITTDDEEWVHNHDLSQQGETIIDCSYGKNCAVVKAILQNRITYYNEYKKFDMQLADLQNIPNDIIPSELYPLLIEKTHGNLSIMIDSIRQMILDYQYLGEQYNVEKELPESVFQKVKYFETIKSMDARPPKLYL